ncbi:hypothetical protein TWF481_006729 [Arthrobotrys musiformis]|uniref:NADP-dependent oxidoreductase domain-containing protein n=1 Tax=Arthrobotrys musiformis TaxID=47236 RepID=A0AAV9WAT8_9PEZI
MLRSLPRTRIAPSRPSSLFFLRRQVSTIRPIPIGSPEDDDIDYETIRASLDAGYPASYTPSRRAYPDSSTVSKRQIRLENRANRPFPTYTLSNGLEIPALGYQAYIHRDQKPKPWKEILLGGYKHIDWNSAFNTPHSYLVNAMWSLTSQVSRSDLFVTAKLDSWWHHDTKAAIYHTLLGLKTGYLDMWVMRYPVSWASKDNHSSPPKDKNGKEIDFIQAWKGMEEQLEAGKVKSLGIANFSKAELDLLLEHAKHKPVVHQMEITPYLQQTEFVEYNKRLGIMPAATAPVGQRRESGGQQYTNLLEDPTLSSIALKHRITTRQLLTAWNLNNGIISIPFIDYPENAMDNVRVDNLILDQEDLDDIASLERGQRMFKPRLLGYHPFADLTDPDLMLENDELPTLESVRERRKRNEDYYNSKTDEYEASQPGSEVRFGTTTYGGTVWGWVRSMEGSRKAGDNKTGHFGVNLPPRKKRKAKKSSNSTSYMEQGSFDPPRSQSSYEDERDAKA